MHYRHASPATGHPLPIDIFVGPVLMLAVLSCQLEFEFLMVQSAGSPVFRSVREIIYKGKVSQLCEVANVRVNGRTPCIAWAKGEVLEGTYAPRIGKDYDMALCHPGAATTAQSAANFKRVSAPPSNPAPTPNRRQRRALHCPARRHQYAADRRGERSTASAAHRTVA